MHAQLQGGIMDQCNFMHNYLYNDTISWNSNPSII